MFFIVLPITNCHLTDIENISDVNEDEICCNKLGLEYWSKLFIEMTVCNRKLHAYIDLSCHDSFMSKNCYKKLCNTKEMVSGPVICTSMINPTRKHLSKQVLFQFSIGNGNWNYVFNLSSKDEFYGADIIIGRHLVHILDFYIGERFESYPLDCFASGRTLVKGYYDFSIFFYYIPK